jgi:oligopeptide transport system substrate-binding protein
LLIVKISQLLANTYQRMTTKTSTINVPVINIIAVLCTVFLYLLSCNIGKKENSKKNIFRYNQSSGISSLDPAFARDQANIWAVHQLFNGLVQFDEQLNIVPCIAKRWHISDDGLTYTFFLREDVFFHDDPLFPGGKGRKLTAADVVYSFSRLIDPATASPGAWIFNRKIDASRPFEAINDTTFILRLSKPFRPMLSMLTMEYTYIVPHEVVQHYGKDFRTHPIGTGPFQFKVWQEGHVLILVKNHNYFEQDKEGNRLPYIDGVKISFIESKETQYLKFIQGELDFISGLDKSYINELLTPSGTLQPRHASRMVFYKTPYLNTEYLGFLSDTASNLVKNHPFQNKLVRQAINYSLDRQYMIRYLRNNIGIPANSGFVPCGLPSFDSVKVKGYYFDLNKARKLLADAGYPDGKNFPPTTLYINAAYEDLGIYIQKQLEEIGLKLKLELVPPAFLREQMAQSKTLFFRGSWIADYPDTESFLTVFYSKNTAPPNYTRFNHPQYDDLYEKALIETNDSLRYELYRAMDKIIIEEAPVVPLFYDEAVRFVRKGISGMQPNAMNLLDLKKVKIE